MSVILPSACPMWLPLVTRCTSPSLVSTSPYICPPTDHAGATPATPKGYLLRSGSHHRALRSATYASYSAPIFDNADLELRRHLIEHRLHDRGHASHHDYIADPEAGRPRHLVENEVSALGDARQAGASRSSPRRWDMDPWDTQVQILIMQAKYSLTNIDYNFSAPTYF